MEFWISLMKMVILGVSAVLAFMIIADISFRAGFSDGASVFLGLLAAIGIYAIPEAIHSYREES